VDTAILRSKVEHVTTLPTIPMVLKRILEVIENSRTSLNEISQFIVQDPSLTSRLLKMVNSAIYGFPGRISSVSHGVVLLGLTVVKGLLLGVSVFELMQETMVGLWEHSIGCATVARIIARKKGVKEFEEVAVAGLLHDIGKVILILLYPQEYRQAIAGAEKQRIVISEVEREAFGVNHSNVGTWLAKKWNFPRSLIEMIEYHHKPHAAKAAPLEVSIIHIADIIVRARGFGYAGDAMIPLINAKAWETVGLTEADLRSVLAEMESPMEDVETIFA
jgi:putative nucleotidyltransferase with HDIG domain